MHGKKFTFGASKLNSVVAQSLMKLGHATVKWAQLNFIRESSQGKKTKQQHQIAFANVQFCLFDHIDLYLRKVTFFKKIFR
jgi:hypothetical protein